MKAAILRRYDINEEMYRQRFRSGTKKAGESYQELATRLCDLATKWTRGCGSQEELLQVVVTEQVLSVLPKDIQVWVRERKPKTCIEAGQLAEDYLQARKTVPTLRPDQPRKEETRPAGCYRCGVVGHLARDCRKRISATTVAGKPAEDQAKRSGVAQVRPKCYNCGQTGHFSRTCPSNALFCSGQQKGQSMVGGSHHTAKQGVPQIGVVEGRAVGDILLDTGCLRTLVHQDLVPEKKLLEGEAVAIRCAHGDTVLYPLAEVEIEVGGQSLKVEAAVSATLPMAVLLGTDVPELAELLSGGPLKCGSRQKKTDNALVVTTRAQAKRQEEEEMSRQQKEQESGVQPKAVEQSGDGSGVGTSGHDLVVSEFEDGVTQAVEGAVVEEDDAWEMGNVLDDEVYGGGRERPKLSRRQKRADRLKYGQRGQVGEGDEQTRHSLDITKEELRTLQETDTTLEAVRRAASGEACSAGEGFFRRDGLVYRRWTPPGCDTEDMAVEQLVLPLQCRQTALQLAHDIPLAGHMGKEKTARRVLQRFYWPTLYRDVAKYCRSCGVCQKSSQRRVRHAPLIPLPIVEEPFQRIAMDIVGPLPRSRSGNRYILVICDYATRYPEAVPLKSIDAEHVAEELVKLFARVGVAQEILTDQGSNFTSQLLVEIYRMLHVHPIRTSPYHPQTDGLVERFNQTLKAMLRKVAVEEGKDWDKFLPYLLFAYREVPQSSTGFSPFELLYGRTVRGPLDVLRESWEGGRRSSESVVSHVLSMREMLEKMAELVQENLAKAQKQQKRWYDQNARQRELKAGDQVLVLLPTSTHKLLAQWQGPYQVLKKVGEVDYLVDMHDHRKRRRIFHINMLREWVVPASTGYQMDEDGHDYPVAYFSRKLLPREERYSTVEKECLAIKLGVQAFRVYLLGRKFTIQTDHRALVWLDRLKDKNSRLTRWSLALQPFQFSVCHRAGREHGNADALSRAAAS